MQYYENFLTDEEQKALFDHLLTDPSVKWQQGKYGERKLPRMLWSMRDAAIKPDELNTHYQQYTGTDSTPFTKPMENLRRKIEEKFPGLKLTYCQLNYYRDGKDAIGFHQDKELHDKHSIYSISLGCTRTFILKPKEKSLPDKKRKYTDSNIKEEEEKEEKEIRYDLNPGSLLVFDHIVNSKYLHSIVRDPSVSHQRVNITFRQG